MSGRKFEEILLHYVPPELCPYPEYRGKPYYEIMYEENGEHFVGFGTYSIKVLSEYLREYFIQSQKLGCEICTNRNIKSQEVCTSPFGKCEFFDATPDRSCEIAQKSIELGRSLGRIEERVESKRPEGEWVYGEAECGQDGWFCSECGFFVPWYYQYYENDIDFIREYKACPHCLAEMVTYTGKDRDKKGGAE